MSQVAELTKVKARTRALLDKTTDNGCTEAEAMLAAAKVGDLLTQYSLSMTEIEMRAETCVEVVTQTKSKNRRAVDGALMTIAAFCDCKVFTLRGTPGRKIVFFGLSQDAEMATYLYSMIATAIETETEKFRNDGGTKLNYEDEFLFSSRSLSGARRGAGRSKSISFQKGMVARICTRLLKMKREMGDAQKAAGVAMTGTALVIVKNDFVAEAYKDIAKKHGLRSYRIPIVSGTKNYSAYNKGCDAGDRINLSRPVGNTSQKLLA